MATEAHVSAFNTGVATAGNTVVVTGVGFSPKVLLFFWTGRTESTDAVGRASMVNGFGFATSATSRAAISNRSVDAGASSAAHGNHSAAACILTNSGGSSIDGALDLQSLDADGFTLVVDTQMPLDLRVHYLALGGDSITATEIGNFVEPGATGTQDVAFTDTDLAPSLLLLMGSNTVNAPDTTGSTDAWFSLGATDGTNQALLAFGTNHNAATMQTIDISHDSEIYNGSNNGVTDVSSRAAFVSFAAPPTAGFQVNWIERTRAAYVHYLAIEGASALVGSLLTQTDTVTAITETSFGFEPTGLLFASSGGAESAAGTPGDHSRGSIGFASGAAERGAQAILDEDAVADSEVTTAVEHDAVYINIATDSTVQGLMDLTSLDSDGFTAIMDDADPSAAFVWYVAFGPAAAAGGGTVQGVATATQAQSATTVATRTVQAIATATQAQAATVAATRVVQGVATASQGQAATAVATVTRQGSATATQTQVASVSATTTVQGTAIASQLQIAASIATLTVQGVATASQDQIAVTVGSTAGTVSGVASGTQAQSAVTVATVTRQGGASASQAQLATAIAQLTLGGVAVGVQAQLATTVATLILQGVAAGEQGQTATTVGTLPSSIVITYVEGSAGISALVEPAAAASGLVGAASGMTGRVERGS